MKKLLLVVLASGLLCSCTCLFTSQDCNCNPDEPYLVESTKDWIVPFSSEDQKFTTSDPAPQEQTIKRTYQEGTECVGGDECCTDYPTHTISFLLSSLSSVDLLLSARAIKDEVEFSAGRDHPLDPYIFASFNVTTEKFTKAPSMNLSEGDTLINGTKYSKLVFKNIDPEKNKVFFTSLEFVKGIGVTAYTDMSGQIWRKK
jgi:hypothetical protein